MKSDYHDPLFASFQQHFDDLVRNGADLQSRANFISALFVEKNRAIRNLDFKRLKPATLARDYLLPRKDLYTFTLCNWVKHIFLPALKPAIVDRMFLFGLGRIFSSYNDTGVQHSTDADINIIVKDDLSSRDRSLVLRELNALKNTFSDHFSITLELDPEFTLMREKDVLAKLTHRDASIRRDSLLFYKSNEKSIHVIRDDRAIREKIFSNTLKQPDYLVFEYFLGLESPKTSFLKLHADREPLLLLMDGSCDRVPASSLIGSRSFAQDYRRQFPKHLSISPPDWVFSMKYFVNRVYDYVGAMRNSGISLGKIGFDRKARELGMDPDYRFLKSAHQLMLYLQELSHIVIGSFGPVCDTSYISRARFLRFMEIDGDKFRRDFEQMVLEGDILLASDKERFRSLKKKIETKSRDRYLEGATATRKTLPGGFRYELIFKDSSNYKIRVPYTWADLGFFVFDIIAARMIVIVQSRLLPALAAFGMSPTEMARYNAL